MSLTIGETSLQR